MLDLVPASLMKSSDTYQGRRLEVQMPRHSWHTCDELDFWLCPTHEPVWQGPPVCEGGRRTRFKALPLTFLLLLSQSKPPPVLLFISSLLLGTGEPVGAVQDANECGKHGERTEVFRWKASSGQVLNVPVSLGWSWCGERLCSR